MPRAGLTPRVVAEEAARFCDEEGFDALTLVSLAKRVGVTAPSLYKHVDGLAALRREVALMGTVELAEVLRGAAVGRAGAPALRAVADAYRDYARAHPGRYAALQHAPRADDEEARRAAAGPVSVLAAVLRGFGVGDDQAVHAIRALRSALHGFVHLEANGGFKLPEDLDESYRLLVEGFVRAFESWPTDVAARTGNADGNADGSGDGSG